MRYTILVLAALCGAAYAADGPILGFDEESSAEQREAEALFDASIDAQEMDGWMKHMSFPDAVHGDSQRRFARGRSQYFRAR